MSLRTTRSGLTLVATFAFLVLVAPTSYAQDPATLPANNPVGPRYPEFIPGVMIDSIFGDDACSDLVIQQGWELVNPDDITTPRRLECEVVAGHPPHGDFNFNHNAEDYTFYVFPDNHIPLASDPTADYRYLIGSGNFENGEPKAKGLPLHKLHREEMPIVAVFDFVDRDDVRVVEGGHRTRFFLETVEGLTIFGVNLGKQFERELTS